MKVRREAEIHVVFTADEVHQAMVNKIPASIAKDHSWGITFCSDGSVILTYVKRAFK